MSKITEDSIQEIVKTEFEKSSRFCFCIIFKVKDNDSFIRGLYDFMVSNKIGTLNSDKFKKPLKISRRIPFNNMIKYFNMRIVDIKSLEVNNAEIIKALSDELEKNPSKDVSERIKKDIKFLENDLVNKSKDYKDPEGRIRIELTATEVTNEDHIKKTFEINPESKILEFIEANSKNEFEFSFCGFLKVDSKKYSFTQGFELGQQTVFSKEIIEKLGVAKISGISFDISKSPLGLKRIVLGKKEDIITFNLEIEFKSTQLSNFNEKITSFFKLINSFFIGV